MRTIFPLGAEGPGDPELISAARAGDADAYDALSARHTDAALRLARQLVPSTEVDDLVAEAFAKVRIVLQHGDGPDLAFRPYLLTAVRRLHRDGLAPAARVADQPESADEAAAARAFTSLAEPWRMVLWHTEVEGQGPEQVAAMLGESPESVPALATRAREGMRIAFLTMHDETIAEPECEWTRHHLGAYVRKVSFDRDTARVEHHLDACARCAAIHFELTEGSADLRGILAPLVLGSAAAGYLDSLDGEPAPRRAAAQRRRARPRAAVVGVFAVIGSGFGRAWDGVAAGAAGATGRVGDQLGRAKDYVAARSAATAIAGVAAAAVVAGGVFVVTQTADGPLEASAEAPRGITLDDSTPTTTHTEPSDIGTPFSIGKAASARLSKGPSDNPSSTTSGDPSDDPTDALSTPPAGQTSQPPTGPGPGRPSDPPAQQPGPPPSQGPSQNPTRPPTQQPSPPPSQPPAPPPAPPATPPIDMGISASTTDLAGLLWAIEVRVTGLPSGGTATLSVRSSSGSVSMDARCSSGGTCKVTQTPSTFRFRAQSLVGRTKTLTFTVYPDGESDANTGNNSTSVTLR